MSRLIILFVAVLASCTHARSGDSVLLPGLLDLEKIEPSVQSQNCNYWFRSASVYQLDKIEGETCLSVETADIGNDLAFQYWRALSEAGWVDLSGGGNELWAFDRSRCLSANIALFPKEQPIDNDWTDSGFHLIWIRVNRSSNCEL